VIITVDTASGAPPYEQIRAQITTMIGAGVLASGDRLPTIAQLSGDLGLANGTVARAYRELESDGMIVSFRRRGTFVADAATRQPSVSVERDLDTAIERFLLQVRQLGVDPKIAVNTLSQRLSAE
jgi:DNA-binding transcriptional regulator YhcF (GntR family)